MLKPQDALTMMNNIEAAVKAGQEKPEAIVKACNLVARSSIIWAINAQKRDTYILNLLRKAGIAEDAAAAAPATNGAPAAPAGAAPRGPNGLRLNVDGTEMSAEESAREDQMDAAIQGGVQAGEIQPGHTPYNPPAAPSGGEAAAEAPPSAATTPDGIPITVPAPQ
jgi:hypothetical protein